MRLPTIMSPSVLARALALFYSSYAWETVLCQQTWASALGDQVYGSLYVLADGANTSQLVAGLTMDPLAQESVPAAVLVAHGEHLSCV